MCIVANLDLEFPSPRCRVESRANQTEGISNDCHRYGNDEQDRRGLGGKTNVEMLRHWILQEACVMSNSQLLSYKLVNFLSLPPTSEVCGATTLKVLLKSLKVLLGRVTPQMMFSKRALSLTHCCSSGLVSVESDQKRFRVSFLGVGKKKQDKTKKSTATTTHCDANPKQTDLLRTSHFRYCSIGALCNMSWPHSKRVLLPMTNLLRLLLKSTNLRCSSQPAIVSFLFFSFSAHCLSPSLFFGPFPRSQTVT